MSEKIVLPSDGAHGERNGTATATCYCGAVQIEVPTEGEGLVDTFICHCTDCRKITASMFASNFVVKDTHLKHLRGESKLTRFRQNNTIATGNYMENSFCSVCGTLMYRRSSGYPGASIPRIGTIDDFELQETKFKPRIETFEKDRCAWLRPADVQEHVNGAFYTAGKSWKSLHDGAGGDGK
ncbi:Mss4-like protein [Paraphoma chrysanthemicola]|nr:Mss4-like protein [Paraphoma chrysanthemicola]